jgi:hypothetical protein
MATAPTTDRSVENAWLLLWVLGGFLLIAATVLLGDAYAREYRTERDWRYSTPTPEQQARAEACDRTARILGAFPWVSLAYAVLGVGVFCHRGCLVLILAAVFTCCPFLSWLLAGSGHL